MVVCSDCFLKIAMAVLVVNTVFVTLSLSMLSLSIHYGVGAMLLDEVKATVTLWMFLSYVSFGAFYSVRKGHNMDFLD